MGKIVFVVGGIKSGKTNYAYEQAKKFKCGVTYIATGIPTDKEMERKIVEHKKLRPKSWQTAEEPFNLLSTIRKANSKALIIDCINFWLANFLRQGKNEKNILRQIKEICSLLHRKRCTAFLISNEIGMSLVSVNRSGRNFQDLLGKVNQTIAQYANEIHLMVAGIAVRVK